MTPSCDATNTVPHSRAEQVAQHLVPFQAKPPRPTPKPPPWYKHHLQQGMRMRPPAPASRNVRLAVDIGFQDAVLQAEYVVGEAHQAIKEDLNEATTSPYPNGVLDSHQEILTSHGHPPVGRSTPTLITSRFKVICDRQPLHSTPASATKTCTAGG